MFLNMATTPAARGHCNINTAIDVSITAAGEITANTHRLNAHLFSSVGCANLSLVSVVRADPESPFTIIAVWVMRMRFMTSNKYVGDVRRSQVGHCFWTG